MAGISLMASLGRGRKKAKEEPLMKIWVMGRMDAVMMVVIGRRLVDRVVDQAVEESRAKVKGTRVLT